MSAGPPAQRPSSGNLAAHLLGRNRSPERARRTYLRLGDRDVSYDETISLAAAAGAGLRGLGVQPGQRVIVATRDRLEFVATFWGAIAVGLVPVPVSDGLSRDDLRYIVRDAAAPVVVCDSASARAVVAAAAETLATVVFVGGDAALPDGAVRWSEVCGTGDAVWRPVRADADDVALWLYTSGTTGTPKGAMHRHRALRDAPAGLAAQVLDLGDGDVVLSMSKMFFAYGLGNSVYLPAAAGATVVVDALPALPGRVSALIDATRPTVVMGVPASYAGLANLPDVSLPESVRALVSAGERLRPELFHRARSVFGLPLLDGLGATEVLHHFTSNRVDDAVAGTAGRPLEGFEVRVRDRNGDDVGEGHIGECWVRGPTTFAGYWARPELTDRAFDGEWMRTGDLVRMEDGRLVHEGRLDDLMKLGGIWVAPAEIEEFLAGQPDVGEAAVVAADEGDGVPILMAYVVLEDHAVIEGAERRLQAACRSTFASSKVPRVVRVVPTLPRTATGKLRRHLLRDTGAPR